MLGGAVEVCKPRMMVERLAGTVVRPHLQKRPPSPP
jgi:hypothetical protein